MAAPMDARGSAMVEGFTVLPVKIDQKMKTNINLYIKPIIHGNDSPSKPSDRTVFVANVPGYVDKECLKRLFLNECGEVENVFEHTEPTMDGKDDHSYFTNSINYGIKVVYVVFTSKKAARKAQNLPFNPPRILSTKDHPVLTGLAKWKKEFSSEPMDQTKLEAEVDRFMENYEQKVEEGKERLKRLQEPDEDGWVTVSRVGRKKGAPNTGAQQRTSSNREKKRGREKELLNFYAFQTRDTKKRRIEELREQFAEDKQKIELMKARGKFKPH